MDQEPQIITDTPPVPAAEPVPVARPADVPDDHLPMEEYLELTAVSFGLTLAGWILAEENADIEPLDKDQLTVVAIAHVSAAGRHRPDYDGNLNLKPYVQMAAIAYGDAVAAAASEAMGRAQEASERFQGSEANEDSALAEQALDGQIDAAALLEEE